MTLEPTPLAGAYVATTDVSADSRGSFARLFCRADLAHALNGRSIVQVNQSRTSQRGAIRGFHFQRAPHAEMKLVRCLRGAAWDVAVDLRAGSSSFLRWYAVELTPDSAQMFVVPEGCAHGFQALAPDTELLYLHTAAYAPDSEDGVAWDDPALGVAWPLKLPDSDGLSERDRGLAPLAKDFAGVSV